MSYHFGIRFSFVLITLAAAAAAVAQPRIVSLEPSQGPIAGGIVVSVRGANFATAGVTIDQNPASVLSRSDTEVRVQMPMHDNGYAIVGVGESYARFLYVPPNLKDLPAGYITTVAGVGRYSGEYGKATDATLQPLGLAFDSSNTLYVADPPRNRVYRVRNGILEPYAGAGLTGPPNQPEGNAALVTMFSFPRGIAFDRQGGLYVPDTTHNGYRLWYVTPAGLARVAAGTGHLGHSGDGGPARDADIGNPSYVVVDRDDNVYFLTWPSFTSVHIRKIDRNGIITTIAGKGPLGFSGDGGPAIDAELNPSFSDFGALALDRDDNLYLADLDNRRIRRIDRATGIITTFVGPSVNGRQLGNIRGLAFSPDGELYFSSNSSILRRSSTGAVTELTGSGQGFSADGTLLNQATLSGVDAMAFDRQGTLYFSEGGVRRIRMVDGANRIVTIAGSGPASIGEGGPAIAAGFLAPDADLDIMPGGEVTTTNLDRLQKIDAAGNLVRIAGSGISAPIDGVPANVVSMMPLSLSVNRDGTIDYATGTIGSTMRIERDGIVRRIAGTSSGQCGFAGDGGRGVDATFCQPWDAVADRFGNLFVADTNNNRIRKVDGATGIVSTVAGSGPVNGLEQYGSGTSCGDGGPATSACINTPWGVAVDDAGNLYVAENHERIRKIDRSGTITTFAEVASTKMTWAFGNLYTVAGSDVSRVSPSGRVTRLTSPIIGFAGDGGPAIAAQIRASKASHGVAADGEGNLYFNDGDNLRVRAIRFGALLAPPGATLERSGLGSIRVRVREPGGASAPGVRVEFAAPLSGPSCAVSSSFVVTDSNGEAGITCASNCAPGTYTITAIATGMSTALQIPQTNSSGPCGRRRATRH